MNWLSMFRRPWGKEGIQFRRLTPSMAIGSTLSQLTIVWQGDFKLLLCELSRQEEKISVLQPKADYFDAVLSCPRSHPHHPDRQRLWLVRESDEQISPREEHPVPAQWLLDALCPVCAERLHPHRNGSLPWRLWQWTRFPVHEVDTERPRFYLQEDGAGRVCTQDAFASIRFVWKSNYKKSNIGMGKGENRLLIKHIAC